MGSNFERCLEEALNSTTLSEVKEYGFCLFSESYKNEFNEKIEISIYELDSKTYLIRYKNEECVQFTDITALKK